MSLPRPVSQPTSKSISKSVFLDRLPAVTRDLINQVFDGDEPDDNWAHYQYDTSSLFINSDGTDPATVGDPVGYVEDLSGNGNHATQSTTADKPVLREDSDGKRYLEFEFVSAGDLEINGSANEDGPFLPIDTVSGDVVTTLAPVPRWVQLNPVNGAEVNVWIDRGDIHTHV